MDGHKKMTYTNFQIFWRISVAVMVESVDLALRAIIDVFEIYTINILVENLLLYLKFYSE